MDEGIHAARFLGRQVGGDVEVLHLAGDLRLEGGRIEAGDAADAARPAVRLSQASYGIADRGNNPRPVTTTRRRDTMNSAPKWGAGKAYFLTLALT
jgi:hypothetical protein